MGWKNAHPQLEVPSGGKPHARNLPRSRSRSGFTDSSRRASADQVNTIQYSTIFGISSILVIWVIFVIFTFHLSLIHFQSLKNTKNSTFPLVIFPRRTSQELRDAFLAIDTGDGQLDALELQEAARKVAPRQRHAGWLQHPKKMGEKPSLETSNDGKTHHLYEKEQNGWWPKNEGLGLTGCDAWSRN